MHRGYSYNVDVLLCYSFVLQAFFMCSVLMHNSNINDEAGSVQENAGPINHVKEPKPANIIMGSKEELLGTFSVYNHRSLHQLKQAQHKVNQNNVMKEEVKQLFNKGKKPDMKRTRLKKKSFLRKARILDTH